MFVTFYAHVILYIYPYFCVRVLSRIQIIFISIKEQPREREGRGEGTISVSIYLTVQKVNPYHPMCEFVGIQWLQIRPKLPRSCLHEVYLEGLDLCSYLKKNEFTYLIPLFCC